MDLLAIVDAEILRSKAEEVEVQSNSRYLVGIISKGEGGIVSCIIPEDAQASARPEGGLIRLKV